MTSIREASGLSSIGTVRVREAAGLSAVGSIMARDATNTLVTLFSAFGGSTGSGLSASPAEANGYTSSHTFQRISTNTVTITVSPAGPVDAVAWSFYDIGWEAISPNSLSTAFRSPPVGPDESAVVSATCTVTRGTTEATIDVPLTCTNLGS